MLLICRLNDDGFSLEFRRSPQGLPSRIDDFGRG
jgi:hypothetical protein